MDTPNEKMTIKQLHGLVQSLVCRVNELEAKLGERRAVTTVTPPSTVIVRREAMKRAREEAKRTGKTVVAQF